MKMKPVKESKLNSLSKCKELVLYIELNILINIGHDDRGVLVLGATNLPQALDSAIRRR